MDNGHREDADLATALTPLSAAMEEHLQGLVTDARVQGLLLLSRPREGLPYRPTTEKASAVKNGRTRIIRMLGPLFVDESRMEDKRESMVLRAERYAASVETMVTAMHDATHAMEPDRKPADEIKLLRMRSSRYEFTITPRMSADWSRIYTGG